MTAENNETIMLPTFLRCLLGGSFGGLVGALISGMVIFTPISWLVKNSSKDLYQDFSVLFLTTVIMILIVLPIGFLTGITTGIHHAIFFRLIPSSPIWGVISGSGVVFAFLVSGFYKTEQFVLVSLPGYLFVGISSGWLSDSFTQRVLKTNSSGGTRSFKVFLSGFVPIFIITFLFFSSALQLQ
jgi:hypothetical protein